MRFEIHPNGILSHNRLFSSLMFSHWEHFKDLVGGLQWQKLKKRFVDRYAHLVPTRREINTVLRQH